MSRALTDMVLIMGGAFTAGLVAYVAIRWLR